MTWRGASEPGMTEPEDDVLGKVDALLRRHQTPEPDIPVLTEVLVPPPIDLDAIPVLTDVVGVEESAADDAPIPFPELLPLEPVAAEEEAVAASPAAPIALEFDIPPGARYVALDREPVEPTPQPTAPEPDLRTLAVEDGTRMPAPVHALSEETIQLIADTIKADVARILDAQLQQALAQQLQTSLHVALDRALASMLDQFVIHIEEVVRSAIANELEKQLGALRRPD